ncbi:hypothetical protein DMC30DRAFT_179720 [Rhodotorula diobovata]|uniref:Uncharacterized protein n=1 Tax=Rhodotorula diobovata TaxID=5288 RepID=A0A5C5FYD6_9BASI|nr:hypothetical protein DMC30DRAFT_179720 [Rhodotorula diobovata]
MVRSPLLTARLGQSKDPPPRHLHPRRRLAWPSPAQGSRRSAPSPSSPRNSLLLWRPLARLPHSSQRSSSSSTAATTAATTSTRRRRGTSRRRASGGRTSREGQASPRMRPRCPRVRGGNSLLTPASPGASVARSRCLATKFLIDARPLSPRQQGAPPAYVPSAKSACLRPLSRRAQKYHTQCSEGPRPCAMCVRRHRAHLCVDAPPKSITENAQEGRVPASRKPRPSLSRTPLEAAAWHASRPTSSTSPYHRRPSPFSAQRIGRLSADSNLGRRSERTASPDSRYRHSPRLDPNTLSSASSSSLAGPVRRSNVRAALDSLRHRWSGGHSDLRAASCSRPAMQDSHPAWAYDEQHSYV